MREKFVLLSQFDGNSEFIKINLATGAAEIISADLIDEEKVSFGLFECEKNASGLTYVALLATPQGPSMLLNGLQFYPELNKTMIKIKDEGDFSHFLVLHEGKLIFGLFYEKKFGIGLHPYNNSREDIDFYYWLSTKISDPSLYKFYAREMKVID